MKYYKGIPLGLVFYGDDVIEVSPEMIDRVYPYLTHVSEGKPIITSTPSGSDFDFNELYK